MVAKVDQLRRELANISQSGFGAGEPGRGREASHPGKIPVSGWGDVLWRAWKEVSEANLFLVAGGVTYAILLALFPGLAALVSLYGLVLDPSQVERQVGALSGVLPDQTRQMLADELHQLVTASSGTLGISAVLGLLLAVWSASRGMSGLITALNIAYEETEKRSFFKVNLVALALTVALTVGGIVVIALLGFLPVAVQVLPLGQQTRWLLLILQWPLLVVFFMLGLAIFYRYAPSRDEPQWRWVSPGVAVAVTLWIVASIGFRVYVANFNSYDKTYGSLGGVIILLTWLYFSSFAVLFGAVVNAQSEKQTRKDSTAGPSHPMGMRGARAADTLGATRGQEDRDDNE
jgi:membrane protein